MFKYFFTILLSCCAICSNAQTTDFQLQTTHYTIQATEADAIIFPSYFDNQLQRDAIAKQYKNWKERLLAIEKVAIKNCSVVIEARQRSHQITLQNGTKQVLQPVDSLDEIFYVYEREFKEVNLLLFKVVTGEGNHYYLLFNTKTGTKTYTVGRVFFSPDHQLLMSINDDVDAQTSFNGFQLFRVEEHGTLIEEGKYESFWAPEKLKWLDDSHLVVKGYYYLYDQEKDEMNRRDFYKQLVIEKKSSRPQEQELIGDFNGDGKNDTLTTKLISRVSGTAIDFQKYGDVEYDSLVNIAVSLKPQLSLSCTHPDIPKLLLTENPQTFGISWLKNIGDVNQDGRDEISVVIRWADWSSVNHCLIYTCTDSGWKELTSFEIREWQMYREAEDAPFKGFVEQNKAGDWLMNVYSAEQGVVKQKLVLSKE